MLLRVAKKYTLTTSGCGFSENDQTYIFFTEWNILFTVYCILYTVYSILYNVHCIVYTRYCIMYDVYCIMYTVNCNVDLTVESSFFVMIIKVQDHLLS